MTDFLVSLLIPACLYTWCAYFSWLNRKKGWV